MERGKDSIDFDSKHLSKSSPLNIEKINKVVRDFDLNLLANCGFDLKFILKFLAQKNSR